VAWVMLPTTLGGRIGVWIVVTIGVYVGSRRGVWPLLIWRCTHYVFTDERILIQEGVVTRDRRDLPLARINDHAMSQSVIGRIFGFGTLTVDSIGDQVAVLRSVPHVTDVQNQLYQLIEHAPEIEDEDEEDDEHFDRPLGRR
jgi:uncharacterized membrane protein YdbT with pleckstrin-like domain